MGRHKEWRKVAKRERRRKLRQTMAKLAADRERKEEQERMAQPEHKAWLNNQKAVEAFEKEQIEKQNELENEKWLRSDLIAQKQWRALQAKIQRAKHEKAEQEIRIKKEWETEQAKIKEAEEKLKKVSEGRERQQKEFQRRIEEFLAGDASPPSELLVGKETKPHCDPCPFFIKTGVCRFNDDCSRNHKVPGISKTLLAPNFFSYFGLQFSNAKKYESDISLEFDEVESKREFREFFADVLPEFERWGKIVQFKVCNNFEKHLRGNVYVQYDELRSAVAAHRALNARWYGGKQISLQYTHIDDWNSALCGLYWKKKCPKGPNCNFLHVFRNPRNMYSVDHMKLDDNRDRQQSKEWRWSESPERRGHKHSEHRSSKRRESSSPKRNSRSDRKRRSERSRKSKSRERERKRCKERSRSKSIEGARKSHKEHKKKRK